MFQTIFGETGAAPVHYRDLFAADAARYAAFQEALLETGIFVTPSHMACWFMSAVHTGDDIERTADAIEWAMRKIA